MYMYDLQHLSQMSYFKYNNIFRFRLVYSVDVKLILIGLYFQGEMIDAFMTQIASLQGELMKLAEAQSQNESIAQEHEDLIEKERHYREEARHKLKVLDKNRRVGYEKFELYLLLDVACSVLTGSKKKLFG